MKQSSKGKTPAHTVTREFTGTEMITSFSTDNNTIKVNSSKPTNQYYQSSITGLCCSYQNYLTRIYLFSNIIVHFKYKEIIITNRSW